MIFLFGMLIFSAILRELLTHFGTGTVFDPSNLCIHILPSQSAHVDVLATFLCGQKVSDPIFQDQLQRTALFHLFIFSGARLFFLETFLTRFSSPAWFRVSFSAVVVFFSGARAAAVRAFVRLRLPGYRDRFGPRGRSDIETLKAGLMTLAMIPSWINSLGLILSWTAALALTLPLGDGWRGGLRRMIALWFFVAPLLIPWGIPAPVTWLLNLVLTPIFMLLLFPLALLSLFDGIFVWPFDRFMDFFSGILQVLSAELPVPVTGQTLATTTQWLWLGTLHVLCHGILIQVKRPRAATP